MTKIKLCGLTRLCDIEAVNELMPEFIGFVFAPKSRRYVSPEKAAELKERLNPGIPAVGVFADESVEAVAELLGRGIIDMAQLHGHEDEAYISRLREMADKPIIKAIRVESESDVSAARESIADFILLDSGGGSGEIFDWDLIRALNRPYFLAGGLSNSNVRDAVSTLHPYAVDVSSGIESGGVKDALKMQEFVRNVRDADAGNYSK